MQESASRPAPDQLLVDIADYAAGHEVGGAAALEMARYCLFDALGCAFMALDVADCRRLLGPIVPGSIVPDGARVPGTGFALDPVKAAFDISCLIRWLDFNDAWATGGHPSDNIGGILASADHLSRRRLRAGETPPVMADVLGAIIKAYEIHGVISEGNVFDRPGVGLDSIIMIKIASTAVITQLFGGTPAQIVNALSNAFADGASLNLYRKVPNAGTRKSWAAADAVSRAVRLALMAVQGEMGYPTVLTAKTWGFYDVVYREGPIVLPRPFGSHVVENVTFKISYPTQRHAQTAAECAVQMHPLIAGREGDIERVVITTHELTKKMISVSGPLHTVAARDHCLEYVAAVGMLFGDITGKSYEDAFAADSRIDALRARMVVQTDARYTRDYYDPAVRSNANAIQVQFRDGSFTPKIAVEYSIGEPKRRKDGMPLVVRKFEAPMARHLANRAPGVFELFHDRARFDAMPVSRFMDKLTA
jgi:2-methylcitrate dehydratase